MTAIPFTDRRIATLPELDRLNVLDRAVDYANGLAVLVEYSYDRKLEGAERVVARLVAAAYAPGGSVSNVLIVKPIARGKRAVAVSAAQVLRLTAVDVVPYDDEDPLPADKHGVTYTLGDLIAGPTHPEA